jgi:hypothetical protein
VASKQIVHLSGTVEQVNARGTGIRLLGEWLYVSQYHPISPMPTAGELIEVDVETTDKGSWINALRIVGATSPASSSLPRDREIRRLACLKAEFGEPWPPQATTRAYGCATWPRVSFQHGPQ